MDRNLGYTRILYHYVLPAAVLLYTINSATTPTYCTTVFVVIVLHCTVVVVLLLTVVLLLQSLIKNAYIVVRTPAFNRKPSAFHDLQSHPSPSLHTPTHRLSVLKPQLPQQHHTEDQSALRRTWGGFGAEIDPWLTIACLILLRGRANQLSTLIKEPPT